MPLDEGMPPLKLATGTMVVTTDVNPNITAAALTELLAIPIELLTVAQFNFLAQAITHVSGSGDPARTIGSLLI